MAAKTTGATRDAIHRALPGPTGGQWATGRAVAEAVGLSYATVTAYLREMAFAGQLESRRVGRTTVWRKVSASPRLRRDDVPTPRAATVYPGDGPKGPRSGTRRASPAGDELVWMATERKGLNYHAVAAGDDHHTACGRATRAGIYVPMATVRDTSPLCPECERTLAG